MDIVYNFDEVLSEDLDFFINIFCPRYTVSEKMTFKSFMNSLKQHPKKQILKQIEELIDQLYNDTYVQYLKQTQKEDKNFMELLHL